MNERDVPDDIEKSSSVDEGRVPITDQESWFCSRSLRQDLQRKTVKGAVYTVVSQFATTTLTLLGIAILGRLLTLEDYGLVALAAVFTGFVGMFVNAGLDMATIQREEITEQQVSNLFWVSLVFSSCVASLLVALSPVVAWFNNDPRLVGVMSASASTLVISGLIVQHQALLSRKWRYGTIWGIQICSAAVAQACAVFVAWRWRTYWALVVIPVAGTVCRAMLTCLFVRWRPLWFRRGADSKRMIQFAANLTGSNVASYVARNADNLLIGTYWGYGALGAYERAYKILLAPLIQLNLPLNLVVMPALSRLGNEPERYREAFLRILNVLSIVTMPFAATAVAHSDLVIRTLLGPQWTPAIPIFAWLGLAGIMQSAFHALGWLFISQGRTKEYFRWGVVSSLLFVTSFVVGLPWGAVGVAISYTTMFYVACVPLGFWTAGRHGPVRTRDYWLCLWRPALLALVATTGSVGARCMTPSDNVYVLFVVVFTTAALVCGAYVVWQKNEFRAIIQTFQKRPPVDSQAKT